MGLRGCNNTLTSGFSFAVIVDAIIMGDVIQIQKTDTIQILGETRSSKRVPACIVAVDWLIRARLAKLLRSITLSMVVELALVRIVGTTFTAIAQH